MLSSCWRIPARTRLVAHPHPSHPVSPRSVPPQGGVARWHPGPGWGCSNGTETYRGKAGEKVEGDKAKREVFYFWGRVRLGTSSQRL